MAHTPKPWKIEYDDKGRPCAIGHKNILIASLSGRWPQDNANLLHASPDMLAALKDIIQYCQFDHNWGQAQEAYDNCLDAIAKAEGRSE